MISKYIENIIKKVFNQEIEKKAMPIVEKIEREWVEIIGENESKKYSDRQLKTFDLAEPKGKLTSKDFQMLGNQGKKKTKSVKPKIDTKEGDAFGYAVQKAKQKNQKEFDFDGKIYKVKSEGYDISLTEEELIELIEDIVLEEKNNITTKTPTGLRKTMDAQKATQKEGDDYAKEVVEKFKKYLNTTKSSYEANPVSFPKNNYQIDKDAKIMKYTPSDAVEEYIESLARPGQTNIVFNEIKPEDKKIKKYLEGDKTTGNAEFDEKGKPLGNVVPSRVGKQFKKNYDENLYGIEQQTASYKRYPQDTIEVAGNSTKQGKLQKKNQSIFNQLESVDEKNTKKVLNEVQKMKDIIGYKAKTQ